VNYHRSRGAVTDGQPASQTPCLNEVTRAASLEEQDVSGRSTWLTHSMQHLSEGSTIGLNSFTDRYDQSSATPLTEHVDRSII